MNNLELYGQALSTLRTDNLDQLRLLTSADVRFIDPFNQLQGQDNFIALLREMFEQCRSVQFEIHQQQCQGRSGFLYWTFNASSYRLGQLSFEGVSRIEFDQRGLVCLHQDIWDSSQVLEKLPLLGTVIRQIRKKAAYSFDK